MKTMLFVHFGKFNFLPPFRALLDYLASSHEYNLKVICTEYEDCLDSSNLPEGITVKSYYTINDKWTLPVRIVNRLKRERSKLSLYEDLRKTDYDILWIIHERTAVFYNSLLRNRKYILSMYELRSKDEKFYRNLGAICRKVAVNVVCEANRAWITRDMYRLQAVPAVLPNKPYYHPRRRNMVELKELSGKKVILYQGVIDEKERNLEGICKAISGSTEYVLVIMGDRTDYLDRLMTDYPEIVHVNYIKPPQHLKVTSCAHIGIVAYNPFCLNTAYCAPNKIWEFSGFGIPLLANKIPGLMYSVGLAGCAVCADLDDPDAVISSLERIESNYHTMSEKAVEMYDGCDIKTIINDVLNQYIGE